MARLVEEAGFEVAYMTGFGTAAATLGAGCMLGAIAIHFADLATTSRAILVIAFVATCVFVFFGDRLGLHHSPPATVEVNTPPPAPPTSLPHPGLP